MIDTVEPEGILQVSQINTTIMSAQDKVAESLVENSGHSRVQIDCSWQIPLLSSIHMRENYMLWPRR